MKLNERLKTIRKFKGLSQIELSNLTDVSQSIYSRYEKGDIEPSYSFFNKIALLYPDINLNWLLTGEGEMFISQKPASGGADENKSKRIMELEQELKELKKTISELEAANKETSSELLQCLRQLTATQKQIIELTQ